MGMPSWVITLVAGTRAGSPISGALHESGIEEADAQGRPLLDRLDVQAHPPLLFDRMDHAMKRATRLTLFLLSIASEAALGQGGRGVVNSIDTPSLI